MFKGRIAPVTLDVQGWGTEEAPLLIPCTPGEPTPGERHGGVGVS